MSQVVTGPNVIWNTAGMTLHLKRSMLNRLTSFFAAKSGRRRRLPRVMASEGLENRILPAISFQFNYAGDVGSGSGFEDAAQGQSRREALELTATQLGMVFDHDATIVLDVTSIEDSGSDTLAAAGTAFPDSLSNGFDTNEVVRTKILTGTDLNGTAADGSVEVNWGINWETSPSSADVDGTEFDFVSTMYHELLHAVGWLSTISETGADLNDAAPAGQAGAWSYFDQFITDASANAVIDGTSFALDATLWSQESVGGTSPGGGLFFNGPNARAANGNNPVGLYTPATWEDGSSVTHMDDDNSALSGLMMLSATDAGVGARNLTTVERAVLRDLGYSLVDGGVSVTESSASTVVSETGSVDTLDVVLTTQPLSNVVLNVVRDDATEVSLSTSSLTFTPQNWNVAQRVYVTGVDDGFNDGDVLSNVTIQVDPTSSDDAYDAVSDTVITVQTVNIDSANQLRVLQSFPGTSVNESGTTDSLSVLLTQAPTSDVVVNVLSGDTGEAEVSVATLTFTAANWFNSQAVTITGVDDARRDGDQITRLTFEVDDAVSDDAYDSALDLQIAVTTVDNETLAAPSFVTGSGAVGQRPTIEWQAVAGASSYEVWINRLGTPNTVELKQSNITETSFTLPQDLPTDNRYKVWVRAHSVTESSVYSSAITLAVGTAPAGTTLSAPSGNSASRPTFEWEAVSGATHYDLWVNQIGGTSRIIREAALTSSSYTAASDLPDGQYRFWVRPYNGVGSGPWSSSLTFSVGATPGSTSPTTPSGTVGARPLFEWSSATNAVTYELWVNQVGGTNRIIHETAVSGTSFQTTSDLVAGTYRFWVRAIGSSGVRGPWSSAATFEVV